MIVQIYEVGSPEAALRLVELGVDHVGVLVGQGEFPREVGVEPAREIFAAIGRSAKKIALSLAHDPGKLAAVIEATRPDVLHLGTSPDRLTRAGCGELKASFQRLPIMRTIPVVDESSIAVAREYEGIADFLLLDTWRSGDPEIGATGETHDWALSRMIVDEVAIPVVLAGGLGPENVAEAVRAVGPVGVDSKTHTDGTAGAGKDMDKVRAFVRGARSV